MLLEIDLAGEHFEVTLPSRVTVNNSDTMGDLARRGFGLIQAPRYRFVEDLENGTLIAILQQYRPAPLSALYPQYRQLAPRLRAFLDWMAKIFARAQR
jgi:DNA-binding transcriptional LysR family regulator